MPPFYIVFSQYIYCMVSGNVPIHKRGRVTQCVVVVVWVGSERCETDSLIKCVYEKREGEFFRFPMDGSRDRLLILYNQTGGRPVAVRGCR
jgi:hypothetical protein